MTFLERCLSSSITVTCDRTNEPQNTYLPRAEYTRYVDKLTSDISGDKAFIPLCGIWGLRTFIHNCSLKHLVANSSTNYESIKSYLVGSVIIPLFMDTKIGEVTLTSINKVLECILRLPGARVPYHSLYNFNNYTGRAFDNILIPIRYKEKLFYCGAGLLLSETGKVLMVIGLEGKAVYSTDRNPSAMKISLEVQVSPYLKSTPLKSLLTKFTDVIIKDVYPSNLCSWNNEYIVCDNIGSALETCMRVSIKHLPALNMQYNAIAPLKSNCGTSCINMPELIRRTFYECTDVEEVLASGDTALDTW